MMSGHCASPAFFITKIKTGRPEHLLTPPPLLSVTSHFCLKAPSPQSGRHMCITPNVKMSDKIKDIDIENLIFPVT